MTKFQFMEIALNNPQNRNHFVSSQEAISTAFEPINKFKEVWRSMFVYQTEQPKESDAMFGNFYIESDQKDFQTNKNIILSAIQYLREKYEISNLEIELFFTNKSIWLMVPAKVFAAYGSRQLNKVYKKMAEEINDHLVYTKKFDNPLDLSIYKWNGLMHALGSFLPKENRWVKKFNVSDLEDAETVSQLMKVEMENFDLFNEITPKEKAMNWYKEKRIETLYPNASTSKDTLETSFACSRKCMSNMEELGFPSENRNTHLFSYALHLKEKGFDYDMAVAHIQKTFESDYVMLPEAKRTVESAIKGSKRFSCDFAKGFLEDKYLDCSSCVRENNKDQVKKTTIIVPRDFIEDLQNVNAHYDCYKHLMFLLEKQQVERDTYTYSLKGLKHKTVVIDRIKKLEEAGIATVTVHSNEVVCQLVHKPLDTYKSHIVVPTRILKKKDFLEMGEELKVLLELWRSSLQKGKNNTIFFNVNIKKMAAKLGKTLSYTKKLINLLQRKRLIFSNRVFAFLSKTELKEKIKEFVEKFKVIKDNIISECFAVFSQVELNILEKTEKNIFSEEEYLVGIIPN